MSVAYEEILHGESLLRSPPDPRHELICRRLHRQVASVVGQLSSTRLLEPRSVVRLSPGTLVRPDLALMTTATGKVWLVAEIIDAQDHHADTVLKKQLYEDINLPRLWMLDPRYDNVEIYHGGPYGLALNRMLAHLETLDEPLLPGLRTTVQALFSSELSA
jgi:Uma2 family endonuclease